jgi:uncharacterized protein (DUF779 family)
VGAVQVGRVDAIPAAEAMLKKLADRAGPLLLHQSGGCCDGSSPMCYPQSDFQVGPSDVHLGVIAEGAVPVFMGEQQFAYWAHTHLTIDLVPGRGGGFSLEAPEGFRFLTRSRLFTDDEVATLEAAGPVQRGTAWAAAHRGGAITDTSGAVWNRPATAEQLHELHTLAAELGEDVPSGMRYGEAAQQLEGWRRRTRRTPVIVDVRLPDPADA